MINLILAVIMRVFTQNEEIERMKQKQKKILDETRKLRKNPKAYLKPLKVVKVERSKSANYKRKFSLLEAEEDSSFDSKLVQDYSSKRIFSPPRKIDVKQKSPLELMRLSKTLLEKPKPQTHLEIPERSSEDNESDHVRPTKKISFEIPSRNERMSRLTSHKQI